jgi:hypothetical protein
MASWDNGYFSAPIVKGVGPADVMPIYIHLAVAWAHNNMKHWGRGVKGIVVIDVPHGCSVRMRVRMSRDVRVHDYGTGVVMDMEMMTMRIVSASEGEASVETEIHAIMMVPPMRMAPVLPDVRPPMLAVMDFHIVPLEMSGDVTIDAMPCIMGDVATAVADFVAA